MPRSSKERREDLFLLIKEFGYVAWMPCTFCERHGWGDRCKVMDGYNRCAECTRRGRSCDVSGTPQSAGKRHSCPRRCVCLTLVVSRIIAEKRRLESAEEAAENELDELQKKVAESHARLRRLRRQRREVSKKGRDMVTRGFRSLDELEAKEREEAEVIAEVQSFGGFGVIDWSCLGDPLTAPGAPEPFAIPCDESSATGVGSS